MWINVNSYGRVSKSGKQWTSSVHWIAVLAYDSSSNKIFIAEPSSRNLAGWYSIDEFMKDGSRSGIGYVTSVYK